MNIVIGPGVLLSVAEVKKSPVFRDWVNYLGPMWRGEVIVNAADVWGGQVHMLQMTVSPEDDPWATKVTLRSETVDVLALVTDGQKSYVVFVEQNRPAAGSTVISNVAGGCDWMEPPTRAARRELIEELGLDGTVATCQISPLFPRSVLATPGLTNERVHMMRGEVKVDDLDAFIKQLHGKRTGVVEEGEALTLHVVPADEAYRFITEQPNPDGKTVLSLLLAGLKP